MIVHWEHPDDSMEECKLSRKIYKLSYKDILKKLDSLNTKYKVKSENTFKKHIYLEECPRASNIYNILFRKSNISSFLEAKIHRINKWHEFWANLFSWKHYFSSLKTKNNEKEMSFKCMNQN